MASVSVIIGSESDKDLGEAATGVLKDFGIGCELKVLSAHRNPRQLAEYVEGSGASVFICIAGLAAALPGSVAALTVYDMAKSAEKTIRIDNIRLVEKHGGRSGDVVNE